MARARSDIVARQLAGALLMAICLILVCLQPALAARSSPLASSSDLHLCKCICFSNSTLIPLFRPTDPSKPCLTCTKQFCLDQKLDICKDARLGPVDQDTGTGYEGDVLARCYEPDSPKDRTIITLYILVSVGLLIVAAVRRWTGRLWQRGMDELQNRRPRWSQPAR